MQQNYCDGVLSNDWNTLLGQQISQDTAISMSRSALENYHDIFVTSFDLECPASRILRIVFLVKVVVLSKYRDQRGKKSCLLYTSPSPRDRG